MAEKKVAAGHKPGYVVLREVREGHFQLVGETQRRPGRTARVARADAVLDATGGERRPGETYLAVLRSEWRIASDC
jgi:hypothetical protein